MKRPTRVAVAHFPFDLRPHDIRIIKARRLQAELGATKANISQHLAFLKPAGVVTTRRSGKQVYAALAITEVKQACHLIHQVLVTQIRKQYRFAG